MSAEAQVPSDHPLMAAWAAHKTTQDYANSKRWAAHAEHVDGSLWALFAAGFHAALASAERAPAAAPEAPPFLLDQFISAAEKAGFKSIHDVPGLMEALKATEPAAAPESAQALKDHEKRNLVTDLCAIAVQFHGHESLRCRIANRLLPALERTHPAPAREAVALSEDDMLGCIQQAAKGDTLRLTRDTGPYEVTEPTFDAQRLFRAIERAAWAANGLTAPATEGSTQ